MRQNSIAAQEETTMRKITVSLAVAVLLAITIPVLGSEGLEVPEALEKTASLEGLRGISLFFTRAYRENGWLYALYCTGVMAILGTVIAYVTDFMLKAVGLEVNKIEHRE
jgi:ABC-type phosphate/phosphonate transport system permease subunit